MRPKSSFDLLRLGLAAYRLAAMASKEAGPLDIFQRFRFWVQMKRYDCEEYERVGRVTTVTVTSKRHKYWRSLGDLLRCPYCLGVWFSFVLPLAPGWVVDWLAVAGVQHVVQKAAEK